MKKILFLALLVLSGSAMAEWVRVAKSTMGDTYYADPASILKNGNMVKMLVLNDLKIAAIYSGDKYLSAKSQREYDCKGEQERILNLSLYSLNMGNGRAIWFGNDATEWIRVAPGSISEIFWRYACGK